MKDRLGQVRPRVFSQPRVREMAQRIIDGAHDGDASTYYSSMLVLSSALVDCQDLLSSLTAERDSLRGEVEALRIAVAQMERNANDAVGYQLADAANRRASTIAATAEEIQGYIDAEIVSESKDAPTGLISQPANDSLADKVAAKADRLREEKAGA